MITMFQPNGHVSATGRNVILLATLIAVVGLWFCVPAFVPNPIETFQAYPHLFEMGLVYQLYISLVTNLQAIAISCLLTVPLSYLTVLPAVRPIVHAMCKGRFLGLTGFVIFFTLLFGGGHGLKVALLVFGMSTFLITSLFEIVENIPREEFDHARTLRMGRWGSVLEVVVLGRFDQVLDAVRQNAAMGWVMLTMVEGLVRFEGGLGALMLAEDKHIKLDAVFAIQLLVIGVGIAQDQILKAFRHVVCPYADLALERR